MKIEDFQIEKRFDRFSSLAQSTRREIYFGFLKNYSSENTRSAYLADLKHFFLYIKNHFPELNEMTVGHNHLVAYKDSLILRGGERKDKYSKRTINRRLSCLGAFYEHLYCLGLILSNPTKRIKRYKIETEIVTSDFSDEQVSKIFGAVDSSTGPGLLHRAILSVLFTTGMRHSELTNLTFKNLTYENEFNVLKYWAKGNKDMVMPLNEQTKTFLGEYLGWCKKQGYRFNEEDFIFRPTKNPRNGNLNKKLDSKSLDYIIKKYAQKIGIKGRVTVHSTRATVIGMLLEKGLGLHEVADFVGHKDIRTTKAYNKRKTKLSNSPAFSLNF